MSDNVIAFSPIEENRRAVREMAPESLLFMLHELSGDIKSLSSKFFLGTHEAVIYEMEGVMKSAPGLYDQWKQVIKQNHIARLRLAQCEAFDRLGKPVQTTQDIQYIKLVLGDLFASQMLEVKQSTPEPVTVEKPEENDDIDPEYDKAMASM